jgi:signal peptidase II
MMIDMLASGGAVLLIDQWTKELAQTHVSNRHISWGRFLRIRCVSNQREIYTRDGALAAHVLIWLVAFASAIILQRIGARFQTHVALYGLGLAFGGAAGNLLDILRSRHIVDFIDLRWWPVFNLADVAIVAGLVVAFWPQK